VSFSHSWVWISRSLLNFYTVVIVCWTMKSCSPTSSEFYKIWTSLMVLTLNYLQAKINTITTNANRLQLLFHAAKGILVSLTSEFQNVPGTNMPYCEICIYYTRFNKLLVCLHYIFIRFIFEFATGSKFIYLLWSKWETYIKGIISQPIQFVVHKFAVGVLKYYYLLQVFFLSKVMVIIWKFAALSHKSSFCGKHKKNNRAFHW
jgi:hypothetical protein